MNVQAYRRAVILLFAANAIVSAAESLDEAQVLPLLEAGKVAWENVCENVGDMSGRATVEYTHHQRNIALKAKFWSRPDDCRADIERDGTVWRRVVIRPNQTIQAIFTPYYPADFDTPLSKEVQEDLKKPRTTVELDGGIEVSPLMDFAGVLGLNLLFSARSLADRQLKACRLLIAKPSDDELNRITGERRFFNLVRDGAVLRGSVEFTKRQYLENQPEPIVFQQGTYDFSFLLDRGFFLTKIAYTGFVLYGADPTTGNAPKRLEIKVVQNFTAGETPFGYLPVHYTVENTQRSADRDTAYKLDVTLQDLSFTGVPDRLFTLAELELEKGAAVVNKLSGQVYEYFDDLDAEAILRELLAAPIQPSTSASPSAIAAQEEVATVPAGQEIDVVRPPSGHGFNEAPSLVQMQAEGSPPETEFDHDRERTFGQGLMFWLLTGLVILGLAHCVTRRLRRG